MVFMVHDKEMAIIVIASRNGCISSWVRLNRIVVCSRSPYRGGCLGLSFIYVCSVIKMDGA